MVNGNGGAGGTSSFGSLVSCGGGGGGVAGTVYNGPAISAGGAPSALLTGANINQAQGDIGHYGAALSASGPAGGGLGSASRLGAGSGSSGSYGLTSAPGVYATPAAGNAGCNGIVIVWEYA